MGQSQLSHSQHRAENNDYNQQQHQHPSSSSLQDHGDEESDSSSFNHFHQQQTEPIGTNQTIKQINRLYGWTMIESMTSNHMMQSPRGAGGANNNRLRYMQNQQTIPTTTTTTTSGELGGKKRVEGIGDDEKISEFHDVDTSSLSDDDKHGLLSERVSPANNNHTSSSNKNNNNRVRRSMAIHAGKHYSISLGTDIHERLQNELKNHDESEKGMSAPTSNQESMKNYYNSKGDNSPRRQLAHHRRYHHILCRLNRAPLWELT